MREKSIFGDFLSAGILYFSVKRTIDNFKPDVIHVHGATNLWLFDVIRLQKRTGYKIFIDSHQDFVVESFRNKISHRAFYVFWTFVHLYLYKKGIVQKYLPITKAASEWLTKRLSIPDYMQAISPLGTDFTSMGYDSSLEKTFRKKYNAVNKLIIVNAGKQYEEKHILFIIEVALRLQLQGIDLLLVLVGSASREYDSKISTKVKQLADGSTLRLPFLPRSELRRVYCAADIGIWPGVPSNTIQEAMGVALLLRFQTIMQRLIYLMVMVLWSRPMIQLVRPEKY